MDYRFNQFPQPVNRRFEEPYNAGYSRFSPPRHNHTYEDSFQHSESPRRNDYNSLPVNQNYSGFLSHREIIITSHYQDNEELSKNKRYRSKSPHKPYYRKRQKGRRSRSLEQQNHNIEDKRQDIRDDYNSWSNNNNLNLDNLSSEFTNEHNINSEPNLTLTTQTYERQNFANFSNADRFVPPPNISVSKNLIKSQNSPQSSLESVPLDNDPTYYSNFKKDKKKLIIENPFSGALFTHNKNDSNNTSVVAQFNSEHSTSVQPGWNNYEESDVLSKTGNNLEDSNKNMHSKTFKNYSPSVISVSSSFGDDFNSTLNSENNANKDLYKLSANKNFNRGSQHTGNRSQNEVTVSYQEYLQNLGSNNSNFVIPEFNSETSKLTPEQWLSLIDKVAVLRGWNDDDKLYMMTSRLRGLASKWYLSKGLKNLDWNSLKNMFIEAFPTPIDSFLLLKKMITRLREDNESIANYFQHKVALLNACEIYGQRAVSCLIYGLSDVNIQREARLQNFNNIDDLYLFLNSSNFTASNANQSKNAIVSTGIKTQTDAEKSKTVRNKTEAVNTSGLHIQTVKFSHKLKPKTSQSFKNCFRCGSPSHIKVHCKKPAKMSCFKCGRENIHTRDCQCV